MKKSWVAVGLTAAALLLSGCGSDATATEGSTAQTTPGATAAANTSETAGGANGENFQAFQSCLQEAGISLPERGSNQDPATRPSYTAEQQAAFDKCRELMPAGAGAAGGMQNTEQFQAFTTCMKDQGVTVAMPTAAATPQARPSAGAGGPGGGAGAFGLDRDDPKVAAALTVCESLLPQRGAGQVGSGPAPTN